MLEPDRGQRAQPDEPVEGQLRRDEGPPQHVAGVSAQHGVKDQDEIKREPVAHHAAAPAAEVVQAGHEEGRGQPDQHGVLGDRDAPGRRGHGEHHDQDEPPGKWPAAPRHPRSHPPRQQRPGRSVAGPAWPRPRLDIVSSRKALLSGALLRWSIVEQTGAGRLPGISTGRSDDPERARFHVHRPPACCPPYSQLIRSKLSTYMTSWQLN